MDNARDKNAKTADNVELKPAEPAPAELNASSADSANKTTAGKSGPKKKGKSSCRKHGTNRHKRSKKAKKSHVSEDESTGSDRASTDSTDSDSSDESSPDEKARAQRKKSAKKNLKLRKSKGKAKKRGKKPKDHESSSSEASDSDSSSSSSSSESSEEETRHSRRRRGKKGRHVQESDESDEAVEESTEDNADPPNPDLDLLLREQQRRRALAAGGSDPTGLGFELSRLQKLDSDLKALKKMNKKAKGSKKKGKKVAAASKRASTLEFKRVDELWDSKIHNYKLTESAEDPADEFNAYIFTVRRKFDWENKYRNTVIDIKSKLLREALQEIMKDVKGVSLVEEQPSIDPNMLFLYLEEIRQFAKKTLKTRVKTEKKKKNKKRLNLMIAHCKIMMGYLDEDYDETKKTLYPMLEAGNITFDLLWALFKPNTIAYTTTYGSVEHPRCFKVDYATKESSFIRGDWYAIEGRYLEYDGKTFGLGELEINVDAFKGPRKITSLATYPLRYHKNPDGLKKQLIERGKRFVTMTGMNYRFHKGLAFEKRKKMVLKHNINGRVMIDPAIFRRINPNYAISVIKPKDQDALYDFSCGCSDDESEDGDAPVEGPQKLNEDEEERQQYKVKLVYDEKKEAHLVQVPVDEDGNEIQTEKLDKLAEDADGEAKTKPDFTDEELLIASPVVLGFAFSEKRWMEFSLSGVRDIEWNEGAFQSLVLPENRKSIIKALVSCHKFHAAQTIDDVVQGKGKGLVFVLHGPPGVGKTLTAEGIADYLKCPLYAVSAGELGTESWRLEQELQKIMDIAHSWGAILLLDEADVFLEKRQIHDIHRNALVSIFLRLLEYFQGILFLTTNRVETFDDAFQSRIHMGLRYEVLSHHAKREIWRMFLSKVRDMEGADMVEFRDDDYNTLARNELNGRQIKNAVRTAQALAVNEEQKLNMDHIKRVLAVAESFERDLKGGTGYEDAMRSYT